MPPAHRIRRLGTAIALLLAAAGCGQAGPAGGSDAARPITASVAYVVDGDTLRVELSGGPLDYVRLVGIDTPELSRGGQVAECGSIAATANLRRLAPDGSTILLRRDSVAASRDRYGRLLAHALVAGQSLELAQLRAGLARVYRFEGQHFDGLRSFLRAEEQARLADHGSWGACNDFR